MFPHPDRYRLNRGTHGRRAGFTLVEALVALTLLTVGLIPAFRQASDAVALAGSIRNSLIASNLAQEGAEVVRGIRDANWFAGLPFNDKLDACGSGCTVQYDSDGPVVASFMATALKFDANTGLYQYGSGTDTLFTRTVFVSDESDHHLKVRVVVEWRERTGQKTVELEYHLYDWVQ